MATSDKSQLLDMGFAEDRIECELYQALVADAD
jgi:hypothetical protein